jgi:mersacidin/lichenicidin family type 2 lantibiotic
MTSGEIIRAWKDPLYRASLTGDELDQLPTHPAGLIELPEAHLKAISIEALTTAPECTLYTSALRRCCPK